VTLLPEEERQGWRFEEKNKGKTRKKEKGKCCSFLHSVHCYTEGYSTCDFKIALTCCWDRPQTGKGKQSVERDSQDQSMREYPFQTSLDQIQAGINAEKKHSRKQQSLDRHSIYYYALYS